MAPIVSGVGSNFSRSIRIVGQQNHDPLPVHSRKAKRLSDGTLFLMAPPRRRTRRAMLPATTATAVQTTTECMEIVLELILQVALIAMSPFVAGPSASKHQRRLHGWVGWRTNPLDWALPSGIVGKKGILFNTV